jgi:hypothetical protein
VLSGLHRTEALPRRPAIRPVGSRVGVWGTLVYYGVLREKQARTGIEQRGGYALRVCPELHSWVCV